MVQEGKNNFNQFILRGYNFAVFCQTTRNHPPIVYQLFRINYTLLLTLWSIFKDYLLLKLLESSTFGRYQFKFDKNFSQDVVFKFKRFRKKERKKERENVCKQGPMT